MDLRPQLSVDFLGEDAPAPSSTSAERIESQTDSTLVVATHRERVRGDY
jgi:hypothetical protein